MEYKAAISPATPESVWAALRELAERQAETAEQSEQEFQKLRKLQAETAEQMKETDRLMKETERERKESSAKFERERRESNADWERRMKKLEKLTGSWANNNGDFAEEYFFNSFDNGKQNFFGEKFDEIEKNLKNRRQGLKDEFDIVLFNHTSVALIEVKYKAHENDIPQVLKKAETFRILFPDYKDFKIYLGLASMSFYKELEDECIKQGIAIIKQVGDTVVINDEHLKAF